MGDRPVLSDPRLLLSEVSRELSLSVTVEPDPAHADDLATQAKAPEPPPPVEITCDHAIFTSIRSPMGQGYRLIASSPGLKPEEKIEITRRSPSHGSLCNSFPDAIGLLSYPLDSGRHCVACCLHAGIEHTARGGLRVYTHMVLLEPADFAAVQADPVRIHAALLQYLQKEGPLLKPPPHLTRLTLTIVPPDKPMPSTDVQADTPEATGDAPAEPLAAIIPEPEQVLAEAVAKDVNAGRCVLAVGAPRPLEFLQSLLADLPDDVRPTISASVDLWYVPTRRLQLIILPSEPATLTRLIAGQDVAVRRI